MLDKAKYILVATVALVAGASCAKVEVEEGELIPVSFTTYRQRTETKADVSYVAPGGDFAAGAEIGVFAFYHNGNGATDASWDAEQSAGNNIPDYMYNQSIIKQDDGTWLYSPIKYWPNETGASATSQHIDKVSFWGHYPRNAAGLNLYAAGTTTAYDNQTSGLPKVTFTQNEDPDQMIDLMFTDLQKDLYKNDAANHGHITNGAVNLVFKHALALVEFQLAEGTGAELNLLELTHIKKSGTLDNPYTVPFVWSDVSGEYTTHIEDLNVNETTLLRILAIPQTISADATFSLNYNITFESSDPTHPEPIVYTGDSFSVKLFDNTNADPTKRYGVTAWEAGKHYIYKIAAGLDRIEFEEIVELSDDWSVGNNNISVPE